MSNTYYTDQLVFDGAVNDFLVKNVESGRINLIDGRQIGIRNKEKVLYIEDLLSEQSLNLSNDCYGIYIPGDEFLKRTKYQWFSVLPLNELVSSKMAISSYFNISMIDASIEKQYNMSTLI